MAVPDFQSLMLPVLWILANSQELAPPAVREAAAKEFGLSEVDLKEILPSGRQTTFANRVAWALPDLKQAGIVESPRRGSYRIMDRGRQLLASNPARIDIGFLEQYPEFQAFRCAANEAGPGAAGSHAG